MSEFPDVEPWPDSPVLDRHHNQPPLEDRITLAFDDAIRNRGLDRTVDELIASVVRAPEIGDEETAGKAGDLVRKARDVKTEIDAERELLNRPLLNAQRALKNKADALLVPMGDAVDRLKSNLAAYMLAEAETVEKPVARGDYGARVGTREVWDFELVDLAKVPRDIRHHARVIATIEDVIRGRVRGGARKIAGVRIFPRSTVAVR